MILLAASLAIAIATGIFIAMRPTGLRDAAMVLLPLNAAADVVVSFGSDGVVHMGQMRAVVAGVTILALLPTLRLSRSTALVLVFLTFLLPLALLSSNPAFSANVYMKFALAVLMLPLGAHVVKSVSDLRRLHTAIMVGVYIFIAAFILMQVFKLGEAVYIEDGIYTPGGAKFTKYLVYAVLIAPLMAFVGNGRLPRVRALAIIMSAIIVLVVFHRSSIVALIAGGGILFIAGFVRSKLVGYALGTAAVAAVLLFAVFPRYGELLTTLAERRLGADAAQVQLQSAGGRVAETRFVFETIADGSLGQLLVGRELFNGGELFGRLKSHGHYRPIHVDYWIILLGSGLIGSVLYALIFASLSTEIVSLTRRLERHSRIAIRATFFALLGAAALISAANQLWGVTPLSLFFFYSGALTGVLRHDAASFDPRRIRPSVPQMSAVV